MIAELFLWILIIPVVHSYILYPISLHLISKIKKGVISCFAVFKENELPFISIIIAAYNEEKVIKEKIMSIVNDTYPKNKIEILVGSDNSTDNTNAILRELSAKYDFIHLWEFTQRMGKPGILNTLVNKTKGEILILTDANIIFSSNTSYELVKYFKNQKVGLVDANMQATFTNRSGISVQEQTYITREVKIKSMEGYCWGTMMGPFGGCYALRKNLFEKIPATFLVDDFFINLNVINQHYYSLNNLGAIVFEDISNNAKEEFRRKVRISAGNFQNLSKFYKILFPPWSSVAYCFLSHKVLRWVSPIFLVLIFLLNAYLAFSSYFYYILFIVQVVFYVIPLADYLLRKFHIHIVLLRFVTHFINMNLALLMGFFKYLKGIKSNVWEPTARNQ